MTTLGSFTVHPVADLFPLIEGEEFDSLVEDIRNNGLEDAIVLTHDETTIVDGRNRLKACQKLKLEPEYACLEKGLSDEEVVRYILSHNIHRRDLAPGQKAIIMNRVQDYNEVQAKERQRQHGGTAPGRKNTSVSTGGSDGKDRSKESAVQTGKEIGVGATTVKKAKKVEEEAPDLAEKVRKGEMSLEAAYKEMTQRLKAQPKADDPPKQAQVFVTLHTDEGVAVEYPKPKSKPTFQPTNDQVSWSAWTWNPVTGCRHGCPYCYARELAYKKSYAASYPVQFTPLFHSERLDAPANTKVPDTTGDPRRGRVFVCSMADLYGKWVPQDWINQVHRVCIDNPQWEYLFLTKFPSRYKKMDLPPTGWIGTSVDTQRRVAIAEQAFADIGDVKVKWLSLEPLLEPLHFSDLSMFNWVVIGAQSATPLQPDGPVGEFAPPFEWVSDIVYQARESGCRIYLKPNLLGKVDPQRPGMTLPQEDPFIKSTWV